MYSEVVLRSVQSNCLRILRGAEDLQRPHRSNETANRLLHSPIIWSLRRRKTSFHNPKILNMR